MQNQNNENPHQLHLTNDGEIEGLYCIRCATVNSSDATFCAHCGFRLDRVNSPTLSESSLNYVETDNSFRSAIAPLLNWLRSLISALPQRIQVPDSLITTSTVLFIIACCIAGLAVNNRLSSSATTNSAFALTPINVQQTQTAVRQTQTAVQQTQSDLIQTALPQVRLTVAREYTATAFSVDESRTPPMQHTQWSLTLEAKMTTQAQETAAPALTRQALKTRTATRTSTATATSTSTATNTATATATNTQTPSATNTLPVTPASLAQDCLSKLDSSEDKLAYSRSLDESHLDTRQIYVSGMQTQVTCRLTTSPGIDDYPMWANQNQTIVFYSTYPTAGFYSISIDGTGRKLLFQRNSVKDPAISQDGKTIVFTSQHGKFSDLYMLNLANKSTRQLTNWQTYRKVGISFNTVTTASPALSRDGQKVVFNVSSDGNLNGLYMIDHDGTDLHPIIGTSSTSLALSPDNKTIAFIHTLPKQQYELCLYLLPQGLMYCPADSRGNNKPAWSSDSRFVVFEQGVPPLQAYDTTSNIDSPMSATVVPISFPDLYEPWMDKGMTIDHLAWSPKLGEN